MKFYLWKNNLFAIVVLFPVHNPGNFNGMFYNEIAILIPDKYFSVGFMHLCAYRHFYNNNFFSIHLQIPNFQKITGLQFLRIIGQVSNIFFQLFHLSGLYSRYFSFISYTKQNNTSICIQKGTNGFEQILW